MKIALLQMDIVWENREANYASLKRYAEAAARQQVDLLVLPEMFSTGFSMNTDVVNENDNGPTLEVLTQVARQYDLNIVAGTVCAQTDGRMNNTAVTVGRDGRMIHRYAKTKLFPLSEEEKTFAPGNGPRVFEMEGISFSTYICFDLRFPELFRTVASECDVAVVIASWPKSRQVHWDALLVARAIENQQFVIGVNRVGQGGGIDYHGGSTIISPLGERLTTAYENETLLVETIDVGEVAQVRRTFPFLPNRA